jgi:hypothetical protein
MRWQVFFGMVASLGFVARATTDALQRFDDALVALDDDLSTLSPAA